MNGSAIPVAALNEVHLALIAESYHHLTGKMLLEASDPQAMWRAPCAIVAHGTEADPGFSTAIARLFSFSR